MSSVERLLAIETSTQVCSVCYRDREGRIYEKRASGRGIHSEKLFTSIDELMSEHSFEVDDLDAVLVSAGPGSYTGLRIAASGVKGLLFGKDLRLYAVQTLASLAVAAYGQHPESKSIHAVIDARREHLYYQVFEVREGQLTSPVKAGIEEIEKIRALVQPGDLVVGSGLDRLGEEIKEISSFLDEQIISASSLIDIYDGYASSGWLKEVDAADFDPLYLSNEQVNNSSVKQS
jgi:tRNA threonylcarbamoyl adenosine modification protein YeaZ